MNRIVLGFCFLISALFCGNTKFYAQPFNRPALPGIAVPGIVSPKINGGYLPGWGVHYSACEMPSNLYAGSAVNSITFELNSPMPASAPFQVQLKIRNAFDVNPLCQLQYPKSWEETWNAGDNPILCTGSFDPTQSTVKLTLPPGVFIYQGGGLEILRDSSSADYFFSMKGYYDQQNMAMWDNNNMRYLLNYKPIIKINAVPPASAPAPSAVSIQNCSGASSFTVRQNVCFYLDNWKLTQSQVLSSNNQYQWRIYAASNLVTSLFDVTTSNSYLELTPTVLSGLPLTVTDFVLKCSAQINTNIAIASYSFQISNDVSTSPASIPGEAGSVISRMKIGKKTPEMSVYDDMLESESFPSNSLISRSQLSLPFQNIEIGNVPTDASPIIYANALQNNIPEFEPGDMMRLELTMNKAMKPMLNHRAYINFDWDADQRFDSLLIFTLANTNGSYQLPSGASGASIVNLIGGTSNEIVYSTDVFIPCDRVKDIPVKFRSGLQRLPTGWDEREEYTIKTLCPVPQINSTAINPICHGQTVVLNGSVSGCVGDFTWYKMPDLTNSIGTGTTYIATESGDYVVKFTIPGECSKYSAEYPVIFSVPIPAPITVGNSRCGVGTVNLSASVSSGAAADWYNNLSGGASINTGTNFTTPILSSNTTYYVEARNTTTGCLSSTRTAVTATINPVPAAPTVTNGSRCGTGTVNLSASVSSGSVADWYNNLSGGASINTGTSFTTPILSSNTTYYVEARNTTTGCLSSTRTAVTATINNSTSYYSDNDGDGFGAGAASNLCTNPGAGYVTNNTDCNDSNASLNSISAETCNGFDDDCDGVVDDGLTFVNYYADNDGDGFGAGTASNLCVNPGVGYVTNNTDCDDSNASLNSISAETCNGFDDDCDGVVDDGLTFVNYYADNDGDGYGAGVASNLCANPGAGYVTNNADCNDGNALLNSISAETCNGFDDDCDGVVDDGLTFVNYYVDNDGEGYGAGTASNLCANPGVGYVTNNTDCNDGNALLNSISAETCNGFDDDCDGVVDDGLTFVNYYADNDGDGYGAGTASNLCDNPGVGYVTNNTDCNDAALAVNPGASESCNSIDDDCDGLTDEGCAIGSALLSAVEITSLPQFGLTGGNYSQNVNMALQGDSPEHAGTYPEKWFKFVAQSNAVRIALTGASTADDNAMAIYDDPGLSYSSPLIPIALEDDVNLSSIGATDQGNEILLTDQLVEGNTYYVVVATVNGTPGNINVKFNTLLPSSCDIAAYTGGTNTFSNVCNNFKCRYRQNAKQAILHRWSSSIISGGPLQSYTIPPTTIMYTVCQLSKFVPSNISASPQTIYVSADVQYELLDAAGNMNFLTAVSTSTCSFTLNPEASINLRSTDACPNFKTTLSSLATDRSVCGTSQYQWEFTMAYPSPGLPINVSGSLGGSRILSVGSISGIANGQRYDVRIRSLHNDAVTYSGWTAVPSCFKTLGAAGMVPWSNNEEQKLTDGVNIVQLYPNPLLQGGIAQLRSSQDIDAVQIFNAAGQLLAKTESLDQMRRVDLPSPEFAGLYWVVVRSGIEAHRLAWLVQ